MIELYELNPPKITILHKKKRNVYPGSLRQNQMFRPFLLLTDPQILTLCLFNFPET